ncbi:hypothetical protein ACPCB7_26595 [Streptomyces arboris]|uniref:hypothetical protein n=1 Tax=Streptomyces arboris TaxID=2600619 RepID=UPI003C303772
MAAEPPAWGVQYTLSLPSEDAALAAAAELSGMGHRLTAVRVHDHFRFVPSSFWYGRPSMDPELEGWWQVFSLAVHSGYERGALEPFLRGERIRVAQVARDHGGFQQGCGEGHAVTLESIFTRDGLVHEQPGAQVALPSPLPEDPARPPAGPPWNAGEVGEPAAVVRAVVAVAERLYGSSEDAPDAVGWLLDEEFALGEPYLADRITALGGVQDESAADHLTRQAIGRGLPKLLSRWDNESDAVRFTLAALAALCGTHDRHVLAWPAALPAPAHSSRAGPAGLLAARRRREVRRPERGPRAAGNGRPAGPRTRRGVAGAHSGAGSAVMADNAKIPPDQSDRTGSR